MARRSAPRVNRARQSPVKRPFEPDDAPAKSPGEGPLDTAFREHEADAANETGEDLGPPQPDPVDERPEVGEPSDFLQRYFRELLHLPLLRPEEERQAAQRLEAAELEWWRQVLSFPPEGERILRALEPLCRQPVEELGALGRALAAHRRRPGPASRGALQRAALAAASRLRELDLDRGLARAAHAALEEPPAGATAARWQAYHTAVQRAQAEVQEAKNAFARANLRLVVTIARRYNFGRLPLADLIQEGNLGLIRAVERFDWRRGYRFSTYASWWIRHAIGRALADKGRAVRLPVHVIDDYQRVARARRTLAARLGRPPTPAELGEQVGIAPEKLERMRSYLTDRALSLDRPIGGEEGGRVLGEVLADPSEEPDDALARISNRELRDRLPQLLGQLAPIEADVLRLRFGLDDDEERTLRQIGEKYDLSRERIRQLEAQALRKLRRALRQREAT
jgi:RNA polymerase primary sigma factor